MAGLTLFVMKGDIDMTFTNNDLKRLKKLDDYVPSDKKASTIEWQSELWEIRLKLSSFIARLEAAEQYVFYLEDRVNHSWGPEGIQLSEAWRKSAGKAGEDS